VSARDNNVAPILADAAYPLDVFRAATGMQEWSMRKARRSGLRVVYVGGRGWVLGKDWIAFLERKGRSEGEIP